MFLGRVLVYGAGIYYFSIPEDNPIIYDLTQSPAWNRGKYIVDGLGHCSMCHTPLNVFGAPKTRFYLTGAFIDGYWSPNITKYGLHSATHTEVLMFSHGANCLIRLELLPVQWRR